MIVGDRFRGEGGGERDFGFLERRVSHFVATSRRFAESRSGLSTNFYDLS